MIDTLRQLGRRISKTHIVPLGILCGLSLGCDEKKGSEASPAHSEKPNRRERIQSDIGTRPAPPREFPQFRPTKDSEFSELIHLSPEDLLQHIDSSYDEASRSGKYREAVSAFPPGEWRRMLDFLAMIPPGSIGNSAENKAAQKIIQENPDVWLNSRSEISQRLNERQLDLFSIKAGIELGDSPRAAEGFFNALEATDLSRSQRQNTLLFITENWGERDPQGVVNVLSTLKDENLKLELVKHAGGALSATYVDTAFEDFSKATDPKVRSGLFSELGKIFAKANQLPKQSDLDRLSSNDQKAVHVNYFTARASSNLNEALRDVERLNLGGHRDDIVISVLPHIAKYDPDAAALWIDSISDTRKKEELRAKRK